MLWEYNSAELPKRKVWEYNSGELPQMKCFENTIMHNCLKGKCGNTTPQSCPKENILRIQFRRIASKEIFWEYNSVELPQRESVGIQLQKVAPKECRVRMQFRRIASKRMLLDATSAKCFRKNVLMTLTQGHNFDLGFLTQGQIWFLTRGRFFIFLNLDDDLRFNLDFRLRVEFWFSQWWLRVKIHLHLAFSGWL